MLDIEWECFIVGGRSVEGMKKETNEMEVWRETPRNRGGLNQTSGSVLQTKVFLAEPDFWGGSVTLDWKIFISLSAFGGGRLLDGLGQEKRVESRRRRRRVDASVLRFEEGEFELELGYSGLETD